MLTTVGPLIKQFAVIQTEGVGVSRVRRKCDDILMAVHVHGRSHCIHPASEEAAGLISICSYACNKTLNTFQVQTQVCDRSTCRAL